MTTKHLIPSAAVAIVFGLLAPSALAGEGASIFAPAVTDGPAPVSALSDSELQALTGMGASALENAIISTNTLTNTAGDVNAGDLIAGEISFSGNALQNATGMNNFVVNTGHGASVQGAVNVNIILN